MTARPALRAQPDLGFTLIEVLVTIVVMGIGVVGLMYGLLATAGGAGASQRYADTRQILAAAAERIQAADYQAASVATANGDCDPTQTLTLNAYTSAMSAVTTAHNTDGGNVASRPAIIMIAYWTGDRAYQFLTAGQTYPNPDTTNSSLPVVHGCFYDSMSAGVSHMQRITLQLRSEKLTFVKRQP